jgi:hypothetical protein
MEGGSLQDHLTCRGSGALVPLTANERVLVLSDVARGLAYLHSEVRVSFTVTSRAPTCCWTEVVMAVLETVASLDPSNTTGEASHSHICRQSMSWAHRCTWHPSIIAAARAVDEGGRICFWARYHRDADWICGLLTSSRSPRLAFNVRGEPRQSHKASSTPRQASMLGPAQARAHRQTA